MVRCFIYKIIFITWFVILCYSTHAQDSTSHEKGVIATVREKIDNFKSKISSPLDSVKQRATTATDTIHSPRLDSLKAKTDLQNIPGDSLQKSKSKVSHKIQQIPNTVKEKADRTEEKFNKPIDEVNSKITAVDNSVQEKVSKVEEKINAPINKTEDKVKAGVSKATDGEVQLPDKDLNITAEKLGGVDTNKKLEGLQSPNKDLPGLDGKLNEGLPSAEKLNLSTDKLSVDQLKEKAGIDIPQQDNIAKVSEGLKGVDSNLDKAEGYEKELKQINEDGIGSAEKLPELAEQKVSGFELVNNFSKEAQRHTDEQAKYEAMIARYKDKKALQQEIARKAQNVANEKINDNTPQFKKAQQQIAKAKKLNPDVKSFKEMKKKRTNEMKGKPFYEHLVPGLTVQAYNKKIFAVDWGMQLSYKITSRFWLGAGGFYRTSFSEGHSTWIKGENVYGIRSYFNFGLYKELYAHGELSSMLTKYETKDPLAHPSYQKVYNALVGIGRRYDISRKLKGSVLILYCTEIKGDLPTVSRLTARIEFNLNTGKRKNRIKAIIE